nr:DUF1351 domain-containing protein [uncultured Ligilactobacillus sp.]
MKNQIMISEPQTKMELGSIDLENKEVLENAVNEYIDKYSSMIVTAETLKGSKKSRANLNKLAKALDEKRKADKKAYLKPLEVYEETINTMRDKVKRCSNEINVQIKDFEQREKEERHIKVEKLIEEMSENYGVSPDEIEINPKWLNKTATQKSIIDGIVTVMKERKTINDNKLIVEKYAKEHGLDPMYYVDLIENQSLLDVEKKIDDDFENKKKREEAERAAEQARIEAEKEKAEQVGDILVNRQTGETKEIAQEITLTICGNKEQLDLLAKTIKDLGIEVINASDRKEIIK